MPEFFTAAVLFLVGISLGSFLNVVVSRLGSASPSLAGRSRCDHCKKPLQWFELIPLLSFTIQSGRCRSCGGVIPLRYPLLELFSGLAVVLVGLAAFSGSLTLPFKAPLDAPLSQMAAFLYYLFFAFFALAIAAYDFERFLVPRVLLLPLLAAGVLAHLLAAFGSGTFGGLGLTLATAAGGYLFFAAVWLLSRGRAMGLGDAEVASVLAFYLPPLGLGLAVILAFFSGALLGSGFVLARKLTWQSRIAFTPLLFFGAFLSLFFRDGIIEWYLRFLS